MKAITSERVSDSYSDRPHTRLIRRIHVATYEFAKPYADGARVLDFGCGTGYGCAILAECASRVVGVDVAQEAIKESVSKHHSPSIHFLRIGDVQLAPLPFAGRSFDVVTSFQVVEHLRNPVPYLREIVRVLRPSGVFLVSTPNRLARLFPAQRPWNRFHFCEYDAASLQRFLCSAFACVKVLGLSGPALVPELTRTARLRTVLFPITNILVPDMVRRPCLSVLGKAQSYFSSHVVFAEAAEDQSTNEQMAWTGDVSRRASDLLAICRKAVGHAVPDK